MKILHVVNHCRHGHGNAHVAIDLACRQADLGHEVTYASAGGEYEGLLESYRVKIATIDQSLRSPIKGLTALLKIYTLIRQIRPDVVHAHMMSGTVLAWLATRLGRIPVVATVHNSFDRHSIIMRLGDRVVAVSEAERCSLIKRGFNSAKIDVVLNGPNGAPREHWFNDEQVYEIRRPNITTVCGIHQRKGVANLIEAFAAVLVVNPGWTLNIVGDGPDREKMKNLACKLGIVNDVCFFGSAPSPRPFLDRADIFVLASFADPCSLAIAEALYAGCPVVATSVGGTPELLQDGIAGTLVPPGDPHSIAMALCRLTTSQEEREKFSRRARHASGHLVIERVADDYSSVYRSAINIRSAST